MHFGNVSVAQGSKRKPSYTFIDDPDTGLYFISAGVIGIVVNGEEVARITSAGVVPNPAIVQTWTVINYTEDRTIDADAAVAVIGDGLATLIKDLIAQGILAGTVTGA